MSAQILPGPSFATGGQHVLFSPQGISDWDVAPDGKRFVMLRARHSQQRRQLVVVENFLEELKARVPQ